jgi:CHAT domain-containing protein
MLERLALLVRLQSSGRKPGGINSRMVGVSICVCVVGLGETLIALAMADLNDLNRKLDLILFAQASILAHLKQSAEDSMHTPLDQARALAMAADKEQAHIQAAFEELQAINREAAAVKLAEGRLRGSKPLGGLV